MSVFSRPPRRGDPLATAAQMRAIDARAIGLFGVPGAVLMENAGRGCAERLERLAMDGRITRRAVIACGPGNNGGDGLVVARTLARLGWRVESWLLGGAAARARMSSEAVLHFDLVTRVGAAPRELCGDHDLDEFTAALGDLATSGGVAIDALFGTGLTRLVDGLAAGVVAQLSSCGAAILAIDVPSGLDADTGRVLGVAVPARFTSTLAALKPGLFLGRGSVLAGEIELVEIGLPQALFDELPRHAG